jgi:peptidoglycan/LPS O-acetylase OafA/YrhL
MPVRCAFLDCRFRFSIAFVQNQNSGRRGMQKRTKLDGLTAARFYAALMIVLFHLAAMPNLELPAYLQFIPGHFALGVPLFFVISAFSLFFGYSGRATGALQIRDYAIRRLFRIAPLFYVMIVVYVAYRYLQYGVGTDWGHIITSATFTFNFFPSYVEGFVWASWTIGIEMVFYALVPLLLWSITTLNRSVALFLGTAVLAALWTFYMKGAATELQPFRQFFFVAHLFYFVGGIVAYFAWLRLHQHRAVGLVLTVAGVISLVAVIAFRTDVAEFAGRGIVKPLQTIPIILFVLGMAIAPVTALVNRFTIALGEASFSLYLLHPLLIGILMNGGFYKWIYEAVPDAGMAYAVCALVTLAILFPVALLGFKHIEVPGNRLGARLIAWLQARDRQASSEETAIAGR